MLTLPYDSAIVHVVAEFGVYRKNGKREKVVLLVRERNDTRAPARLTHAVPAHGDPQPCLLMATPNNMYVPLARANARLTHAVPAHGDPQPHVRPTTPRPSKPAS